MGVDVGKTQFTAADLSRFQKRLRQETAILARWFKERAFDNAHRNTGMEVEFWLVDQDFQPAPSNAEFLSKVNQPQVVPEISQFNAELNLSPQPLDAGFLSRTHVELENLWRGCQSTAASLGLHAVTIGSLPTLRDGHLRLEFLSDRDRYRALNEQVMALRKGKPIRLDIDGADSLVSTHNDVMLEASATSLQSHLQVEADKVAHYFNASFFAMPGLVAVAANSPYLFGQDLWDETRIPAFEQAVRLPSFTDPDGQPVARVHFGSGFVRESLLELFLENMDGYPVLLPQLYDEEAEWLAHVRLHNGNIWRWNRPVLGITRSGKPHLRIEQRAPSAGPTVTDMIANHAFFIGLTHWLATEVAGLTSKLSFSKLREGFYEGARHGLAGSMEWVDGKTWDLQKLLAQELVPQAKQGLLDLGVGRADVDRYVGSVITERVRTGRTGAAWQRAYVSTHGKDFQGLLAAYFKNQENGLPVHEWTV